MDGNAPASHGIVYDGKAHIIHHLPRYKKIVSFLTRNLDTLLFQNLLIPDMLLVERWFFVKA